jgi:hypothetical protein
MRDFFEKLGDQLEELGRAEEEAPRRGKSERSQKRKRRLLVAVPLAIAACFALLLLQGSRPEPAIANFPVLQRPVSDAREIAIAPELKQRGAHLRLARGFRTPVGRGYAIPTVNRGLCVAVPDGAGGYGQSCRSHAYVVRRGLAFFLNLPRHPGGNYARVLFVALLPSHASAPVATTTDGHSRRLVVDRGVSTGVVRLGALVTYDVDGATVRVPAVGTRPAGHSAVTICPRDEKTLPVPPPAGAGRTKCP